MTHKEAVKIWVDGATEAMVTANKLYEIERYHHSLFFLYLALEKIFKAIYVSKHNEAAPYTHSLIELASKNNLKLSSKDVKNLGEISEFNVSARYESHKYKIYKKATREFTSNWIKTGKKYFDSFKDKI